MVLSGLIRLWLVVMNFVYGCVFWMCLSGGFWKNAIFSRSVVVQSGFGMYVSWWSHGSSNGLILRIVCIEVGGVGFLVCIL